MQPVPETVPMLLPVLVGGIFMLMLLVVLVALGVWLLGGRRPTRRAALASERAREDEAALLVQQAIDHIQGSGKSPDR